MIETASAFFGRLRLALGPARTDDVAAVQRASRNDLVSRLDSLPTAPPSPGANATSTLTEASANGALNPQEEEHHHQHHQEPQQGQQPPALPSAGELNSADCSPHTAAPLRLPPQSPPAWLHLNNLQLYLLRNQHLEQLAARLLDCAAAAVPPLLPAAPAAPWAAVIPLVAACPDVFGTLLERRLVSILTSRVHTLVGCFDTAAQLYDAMRMDALPPEVRQAGVFVVVNTSEAATQAQMSFLRDRLLSEPVLRAHMPVTRQDFAAENIWDTYPQFMPFRDILCAMLASSPPGPLYDMLLLPAASGGAPFPTAPAAAARERADAAVAAATRATGLPDGFQVPRALMDAALAAAARSLLAAERARPAAADAASSPANGVGGTDSRPAAFTGAQTPYSVTVTGSHNAYLYGEFRQRLRPLDAALSGGDTHAPPELVPLGFRPGAVVRDGRLQYGVAYGDWTAESQLAINALGTLTAGQFAAAAERRAGVLAAAVADGATAAVAKAVAEAVASEKLPPLMNGLNTPVLVLSGGLTSTPMHVEDLALPALNTNVGPAAKLWDVALLGRVGRDPVMAAAAAVATSSAGSAERLYRLRNKQDFRDLLELGHDAGWADGAVISVVQQPGMRIVTTAGYVWHDTVSPGASVALSTNWMELPTAPEGAWRAHFDVVLEEMAGFARAVGADAAKMQWMEGTLQLLDGALGSGVRAQLSVEGEARLRELQGVLRRSPGTSRKQGRKRRR